MIEPGFNDLFLEAASKLPPNPHNPKISETLLNSIRTSPLFVHNIGEGYWHGDQFPEAYNEYNMPVFPFPAFRLSVTNIFHGETGKIKLHIIAQEHLHERQKVGYHYMANIRWFERFPKCLPGFEKDAELFKIGEKNKGLSHQVVIGTRMAMGTLDLKHISSYNLWSMKHGMEDMSRKADEGNWRTEIVHELLCKFCIDWMNPHFFPAKVSPPPDHTKSIQWMEQRSHYVLVHKSHPANTKASLDGAVNCRSSETRMAHARRAHFRLLRHPKFKNKLGQKVFVRATWCGPKEWRDGSGQIYRLSESFNPKNN